MEGKTSKRGRRPTLPHCGAVPSARPGLTSLFGMGRGGTPGPKPPNVRIERVIGAQKRRSAAQEIMKRLRKAACRGTRHGRQSRRAISSARLRTSPPLHLRPIDVVVCDGPVRPNLAEGFALRCTQRLSAPGVATLRCAWRHSRQTSGRSVTVLSY